MYLTPADVDGFFEMVAQRLPGATVVFDTIPAWAATRTGHRQSAAYRMPPNHGAPAPAAFARSAAAIAASPEYGSSPHHADEGSHGGSPTQPQPACRSPADCCP